jgi:hypothetical protein
MTDTDTEPADKPAKRKQYPRNRGVFRGIDLRTIGARRIRAFYAACMKQAELPDELIPQSAALKVAKLQVIVERLQNESLKSKKHSRQLGSELVRHENMLRRAKLELIALKPKPLTWWERKQLEQDDTDAEEENDE